MENRAETAAIPLFRKVLIVLGKSLLLVALSALLILIFSYSLVPLVPKDQADAMAVGDMSKTHAWVLNLTYFLVTGSILLSIWIVRRLISKQPLASVGLSLQNWPKEFGEGWILGTILVSFGYFLLLLTGMAHTEGWHFVPFTFLGWLLLFLLQPFMEELLFRGYIMSLLARYFNIPTALVISSLVFAIIHVWNDGFTSMGFVTITIAGFLFGLLFLKTGRLWLPTGMHAAWNFVQGVVFGFPTSGIRTYSITETTTSGPDWLSGGAFGFEGSILAILLILAAIWWYRGSYQQEKLSAVVHLTLQSPSSGLTAEVLDEQVEG